MAFQPHRPVRNETWSEQKRLHFYELVWLLSVLHPSNPSGGLMKFVQEFPFETDG